MTTISKYIRDQDEICQKLSKKLYFEKTDIVDLKSTEIIPFSFDSFPEFNRKMKKYVQDSSTRTFPRNSAKQLLQRGMRKEDGGPITLSRKYCRLEGRGMLRPPRSFEGLPNEFVDITWTTIHGVFSNAAETRGGKLILPNNRHLKSLMEKTGFCMYSNQHLETKCHFFSCPLLQKNESDEKETDDGVHTSIKDSDYLDYDTLDLDPTAEDAEDAEDADMDYGDEE